MRIAQVCPYDWHAPGGVQTHVRRLSQALMARGHDVLAIAPGRRPADEPWVRIVGRPISVRFNGSRAPICPRVSASIEVRRLLRSFDPEIVHAHEPMAPSLGLFAAIFARAPVVGTFHALCETGVGHLCQTIAARPFNWRLSAGIAVSMAAMRSLRSGVRIPMHVIPNGVADEFLAVSRNVRSQHPPRLLFAHRLEPRKGLHVALRAFASLASKHPHAELTIIGDGDERRAIDALPVSLRARIHMRGTVPGADLMNALAESDIFLAPALGGESFGMALLEAMATGMPVVASRVGGYGEVVRHEIDGLLVPPNDPEAFAAALDALLADPVRATAMGAAGRIRAEGFTWDRIAAEVESVFCGVRASRPYTSPVAHVA